MLSDDGTDNGGVEQEVIAQKSPSAPGKEETEWFGFKLVGDNIDKTIRPRFQRHDHQTQSLHHFASYAALDRVNMSTLSDKSPEPCQPDAGELVLSSSDLESIAYDFTILMSRYVHVFLKFPPTSVFKIAQLTFLMQHHCPAHDTILGAKKGGTSAHTQQVFRGDV